MEGLCILPYSVKGIPVTVRKGTNMSLSEVNLGENYPHFMLFQQVEIRVYLAKDRETEMSSGSNKKRKGSRNKVSSSPTGS